MQRHPSAFRRGRGFTLLEVTIVIALTGIALAMVAVFIPKPINAYIDTARRAELTDTADTALRRVAREIAGALPNSVRVDPTGTFLEFLPMSAGGRYRAAAAADGSGDFLDFTNAGHSSFDVLGPPVTVAAGDQLVIYNLGLPGADAYSGESRRPLQSTGSALANLTYKVTGGAQFAYPSPGSRFQVVNTPVSYVCLQAPLAGVGSMTLQRYGGYAIQAAQPTSTSAAPLLGLVGRNNTVVANKVATCSFAYSTTAGARNGLVTLRLGLQSGVDIVSLVTQVRVDNSP
jgi:MSHA biogenesis protein MshO